MIGRWFRPDAPLDTDGQRAASLNSMDALEQSRWWDYVTVHGENFSTISQQPSCLRDQIARSHWRGVQIVRRGIE